MCMSDLDRLVKAIGQRDVEQIRKILDEHSELVHERDETGATALHYAAFDGLREIVELLLDRGAEINSRTAGSVPRQPVGPSSICGSEAASSASS
jgi:ankyrin repeat protein